MPHSCLFLALVLAQLSAGEVQESESWNIIQVPVSRFMTVTMMVGIEELKLVVDQKVKTPQK